MYTSPFTFPSLPTYERLNRRTLWTRFSNRASVILSREPSSSSTNRSSFLKRHGSSRSATPTTRASPSFRPAPPLHRSQDTNQRICSVLNDIRKRIPTARKHQNPAIFADSLRNLASLCSAIEFDVGRGLGHVLENGHIERYLDFVEAQVVGGAHGRSSFSVLAYLCAQLTPIMARLIDGTEAENEVDLVRIGQLCIHTRSFCVYILSSPAWETKEEKREAFEDLIEDMEAATRMQYEPSDTPRYAFLVPSFLIPGAPRFPPLATATRDLVPNLSFASTSSASQTTLRTVASALEDRDGTQKYRALRDEVKRSSKGSTAPVATHRWW